MKPIEKRIKNFDIDINPEKDKQILNELCQTHSQSTESKSFSVIDILGMIMKSKLTKFATAAVIIISAWIGINIFKGTPAWAIDQTIQALVNIRSATVYGTFNPDKNINYNFRLFVKAVRQKSFAFNGRVESDRIIGLIRDNVAYQYELGTKEIYAYNLQETKGRGAGSRLWCEMTKNAPWIIPIAPTMLQAAKLLANDYQEIYKKDEATQRQCVFITGSYRPLSASFFIVFDLESKLIVRAKYWENPDRQGTPNLDIEKIIYNDEIKDEIFDLEKTTDAKVVTEKETQERFDVWKQAMEFEEKNEYLQAIKAHEQIFTKYPNFVKTPEALCQIAMLYYDLGNYDKAIEYFNMVPQKYSAPRYAILDSYMIGGFCYSKIGQDDKALRNYQISLKLIDQWSSETDWTGQKSTRWQKAKKMVQKDIAKIKNKK